MDISTPLLELILCCCRLGAGLVGLSKPVRTYFGSEKENIGYYGQPHLGALLSSWSNLWTCQECQRRKLSFWQKPSCTQFTPVVFRLWGLNLVSPLPVIPCGSRYVLPLPPTISGCNFCCDDFVWLVLQIRKLYYYPGQKKKEPSSRFAARRMLFHVWYHARSGAISAGQVRSATVRDFCPALIAPDRAWYHTWNSVLLAANLEDGSFFLSRVVE